VRLLFLHSCMVNYKVMIGSFCFSEESPFQPPLELLKQFIYLGGWYKYIDRRTAAQLVKCQENSKLIFNLIKFTQHFSTCINFKIRKDIIIAFQPYSRALLNSHIGLRYVFQFQLL